MARAEPRPRLPLRDCRELAREGGPREEERLSPGLTGHGGVPGLLLRIQAWCCNKGANRANMSMVEMGLLTAIQSWDNE